MNKKAILISIDGMRPDGILKCGNPFVTDMMKKGAYTLDAQTVEPSVTLPCHMSMFHSVKPERHGILTNTYTPQVRPIDGLFEQLSKQNRTSAMFYGWGPIRDVAQSYSLTHSAYINAYAAESTDTLLTNKAIETIDLYNPDFTFLYMVETDEKGGHDSGWMTPEYLRRISCAADNVKEILSRYSQTHTVIVTADHGGHDRMHGTAMPEDMTIPMFFFGEGFTLGREYHGVSILDLAPTLADALELTPAAEWEGRSLIQRM